MAKKKIAALLIAAAVAAGGWALPARVSAAENDGTAVTWQQDETESSEQNSDEEAAVQEQSGTSENETPAVTIPGEDNEQEPEEKHQDMGLTYYEPCYLTVVVNSKNTDNAAKLIEYLEEDGVNE